MPPTPPDITERFPALLSSRTTSAEAEASGVLYDVVVSGIGFVFAVDSRNPYVRQTEQVQKQQIDTSTEAGEQSLGGPWVRSQTSWHLGAGADYYEPGNRDETTPSKFRYKDSRGVDPWTVGQLSLHRAMTAVTTTANPVSVCGARRNGEDIWFSFTGSVITRHDSVGATSHATGLTASDATYGLVNAGSVLLTGGTTGVQSSPVAGGAPTSLITRAAGAPCVPWYVKSRIITTSGPAVHEHSLAGGAMDATSLQHTHPDAGWTWSGVTETPDSILLAGYSNGVSSIYAMTLVDAASGSVPDLGQPYQVAELPPGEEIRSIRSYLGLFLGIGTTAGIRIGVIGDMGKIQYGPLLVETSAPVTALAARDSFLYAATANSVIRVNLAEPIGDTLRFPYAYDVEIPAGKTITSLAFDGVTDVVVVGSNATGTYAASTTAYVSTGWLESGDIRYGTTAPKAFRLLDVEADTSVASTSVGVSTIIDGSQQSLVVLGSGRSGASISLGTLPAPLAQLSYRLDFGGGAGTPVVGSVGVKAIPVPPRQRLIQYPVHMADFMRDSRNAPFGGEGYASRVLESLEALETTGTIVTVHDKTRPEQFEATIEEVQFTRIEPRARGNGQANFGGIGKITVKSL